MERLLRTFLFWLKWFMCLLAGIGLIFQEYDKVAVMLGVIILIKLEEISN